MGQWGSGVNGTLGGVAFGLLVALNIGTLVLALERLLGTVFLPSSRVPDQPHAE